MASKIAKLNDKIAEAAVKGYRKIEAGVIGAYQKVEKTAIGTYQKMEDKMVEKLFVKGGESIDEAKARLRKGNNEE